MASYGAIELCEAMGQMGVKDRKELREQVEEEEHYDYDDEMEVDSEDLESMSGNVSDNMSLSSIDYRGYIENGRRYQSVREGDYWGPSDEAQFESMAASHLVNLILESQFPNPLFKSPLPESAQHILDIGTGDGAWARDVADRYPTVHVTGVDLFPVPDSSAPPNCTFEVDDIDRDWVWDHKWDLIHLRWFLGTFDEQGWERLYKQAYDNLKPGGWIEQVEPSIAFRSDDGTLPPNSYLAGWSDLFYRIVERSGKSIGTWEEMRPRIEAAGFIKVHEKMYKAPYGTWPRNQIFKDVGRCNMASFKDGMEGYVMSVLTKFGLPRPWTAEEVRQFLDEVRKELDSGWHVYHIVKRVWAQKPFDPDPEGTPFEETAQRKWEIADGLPVGPHSGRWVVED